MIVLKIGEENSKHQLQFSRHLFGGKCQGTYIQGGIRHNLPLRGLYFKESCGVRMKAR